MQERETAALRPLGSTATACLVMVCKDLNEADQIASLLAQYDAGCLVTYRRAEDLVTSAPQGRVSLVILAGEEDPAAVGRMLKWLRRRWPDCPVTVVGSPNNKDLELAARTGGASYLVRPVSTEEWTSVVCHTMKGCESRKTSKDYRPV